MKKQYKIKFTFLDGAEETFTINSDNVEKFVLEYSRNHPVASHEIISETNSSEKGLLLG